MLSQQKKTHAALNASGTATSAGKADVGETFLREKDLAQMFPGISPKRWERARLEGWGPPYIRIGRTPLYRLADVLSWAEGRKFTSTSGEP